MELAVDDFSGGELVEEELALSWLEIIELVITFFCCKTNYVLVRKVLTEPLSRGAAQYSTYSVLDPVWIRIQLGQRIRIRNGNPDSDRSKLAPKKGKDE
jgi:hypothetical protein